ncbi:unnamed protein product [Ectocarpus sp. CCAP 1310/34]|nr:unnamed protein product [Ectocarpus sp. CCAP 1310/34]
MRGSEGVDYPNPSELFDAMSANESLLDRARVSPLAYAGFVPVSVVHPSCLLDRRGRQKVSVLWGVQVIQGIKHDSVELVRGALRHEFSNPEERLEDSGPAGAAFSFANAAIFTQEQMDRVVDDLKLRTRETNAKTKRFVSDSEWLTIDQTLGETGTYASVLMSRATSGDTGLHIAITLGSLRAAQVFVEEGCDVTILNDDGVSAVAILRQDGGDKETCFRQTKCIYLQWNLTASEMHNMSSKHPKPAMPSNTLHAPRALSDNFDKVMELVLRTAQLEEDFSRKGITARRLTAAEKVSPATYAANVHAPSFLARRLSVHHTPRGAGTSNATALGAQASLAQLDRVAHKANEYRLFGHGLACYFVDRLSDWPALQARSADHVATAHVNQWLCTDEEARACEIEGREMLPAAQRELRLCEVMCRYLEQCEAIRDREHEILPPLTPEDLDSKADRFTGVLDPKGEGGSGGSRCRRRQEDSGGHSSSQDRVTLSAGANAIMSARMALSIMGATRSSGGTGGSKGDGGGGDVRWEEERGQHQQQSVAVAAAAAAGSSIAGRPKGLTARITAAQRHAFDKRATHSGSNSNNTTIAASSGTGEEAAAGGRAAAARGGSMPAHFQGRSLMSAEWSSKPGKGAAGRRSHPRYPTKRMTPESWTATGKDRDTPSPAAGGDLPPPSATAAGVGEKGTAKK